MSGFGTRLAAVVVCAGSVLGGGCASQLTDGDRFFLAGDLVQAEAAYREYLTSGQAGGDTEARARYRLGLIYALPGGDLHDRERADRALETLIAREPGSAWAQQATFLLSLRRESDRLAAELAAQTERADFLLAEVERLEAEAEHASAAADEREQRVGLLVEEIEQLKQSIGDLNQVLARREQELEEIKRIDLQTPP